MRAGAILRERNLELSELEVLDTGKPFSEVEAVDIITWADCIEHYAGLEASITGDFIDYGDCFAYTRREPVGVCAGIGAWNYPIQMVMWKSGPALACGNAMVFKPPEVTLELGGRSPLIIFDDTETETAVRAAMLANFLTQGEICANGTRVFVQRGIYEDFLQALNGRVEALRIGEPMHPTTQVDSLISAEHLEKVMSYLESGKVSGARLLCGGGRPDDPKLAKGCYVQPTVFTDSTDDMRHVREEIFGPMMSVLPFDSEEEVIARANATEYGLAAGVFTKDISRAHRVVAGMEVGTCWINTYHDLPISMPLGGYRGSGVGRENGQAVINHYTQIESVFARTSELPDAFA